MNECVTGSANPMSWIARDPDVSRAVGELFVNDSMKFGCMGEFISIAGLPAYIKAEPMGGQARWRHYFRKHILGRPYPRLAEFENLRWLAERGFRVAQPLAAGVRRVWNGIDWQFLITLRFEGTERIVEAGQAVVPQRLKAMAAEVARMHDLGFIHRDLHLRNLAWCVDGVEPQVLFYDAWRGGARKQSRGATYDVACLTQGLAWEVGEASALEFLELYLSCRAGNLDRVQLRARVARERQRLLARQQRSRVGSPQLSPLD